MSDDSHLPRYIKLRDFESPTMPTQRAFQLFLSKALMLLKKDEEKDEDAISSDRLHKTPDTDLDLIASPPASGPLIRVLDENLADWLHIDKPQKKIEVIVLPSCDDSSFIESWAKSHGIECLKPPTHQAILTGQATLPDILNGPPLAIPQLEAWMMRTYYGLNLIRQLLFAIENSERKIIIGCNAYAWEFLKKAVDAASFLPDPMTFESLDSKQLRDWFYTLHSGSDNHNYKLCHQKSAQDIFTEDDEDSDNYFKILAATSSGIPWVAWHLWRNSLLTQKDDTEVEDVEESEVIQAAEDSPLKDDADQQILWVAALQEFALPSSKNDLSLLMLQAILIHNEISIEHLVKVLPDIRPLATIPLLKRAGIIRQKKDRLSCVPEAYPAIREGLVASGFPVGVL